MFCSRFTRDGDTSRRDEPLYGTSGNMKIFPGDIMADGITNEIRICFAPKRIISVWFFSYSYLKMAVGWVVCIALILSLIKIKGSIVKNMVSWWYWHCLILTQILWPIICIFLKSRAQMTLGSCHFLKIHCVYIFQCMYNIILKSDFSSILLYYKKHSLIMHDFRVPRVVLPLKLIVVTNIRTLKKCFAMISRL